jgi:hypothetical protein
MPLSMWTSARAMQRSLVVQRGPGGDEPRAQDVPLWWGGRYAQLPWLHLTHGVPSSQPRLGMYSSAPPGRGLSPCRRVWFGYGVGVRRPQLQWSVGITKSTEQVSRGLYGRAQPCRRSVTVLRGRRRCAAWLRDIAAVTQQTGIREGASGGQADGAHWRRSWHA